MTISTRRPALFIGPIYLSGPSSLSSLLDNCSLLNYVIWTGFDQNVVLVLRNGGTYTDVDEGAPIFADNYWLK